MPRCAAAAAVSVALLLVACGSDPRSRAPSPSPADGPPTSSGSATASPTPDATRPTAAESSLAEALVRFARGTDPGDLADVPLAVEVWLGLGPDVVVSRTAVELREPDAWRLQAPAFRGYVGPFSALDLLSRDDRLVISVGDHPHCASGPVPAPPELDGLRRVSLQPGDPDGCLAWWTVDLFVDDRGAVTGITIDLWEP